MFKEKFHQQESVSEAEQEKESGIFKRLRNKVMTGMFLGSLAVLEACGGIQPEEIKQMPASGIEDVQKNPDQFSQMPLVKVEGYPVLAGNEDVTIPIARWSRSGKTMRFDHFDYITQSRDVYDIHATSDLKSPALRAYSDGTMLYFPHVPLRAANEKMEPHKYGVAGKIHVVEKDGKKATYMEIAGSLDEEAPAAAPGK